MMEEEIGCFEHYPRKGNIIEYRHLIEDDIRWFMGVLNVELANHLFPNDYQRAFEAMNNVSIFKIENGEEI